MSATERDTMRKIFFDAWHKHQNKGVLEPLEAQIVAIILKHPEYHAFLSQYENLQEDLQGQNPFFHMSLHLALQEQIMTDRPGGIKAVYAKLCLKLQDAHVVEHTMMECLAAVLWDAQSMGKMPDEKRYLEMLLKL